MALVSIASTALKSSGRPNVVARLNLIWAASTMALAAAVLPLGVVGVAAGVSVGAALTAVYALHAAAGVVGVRRELVLQAIWPPAVAAGATSLGVASLEHFVLHASDRTTTAGLMLLALEIFLGAVGYLTIMAVLDRAILGEAFRSIRLALGGARASQAQKAANGGPVLAEPGAQRESTGAP
jgi:hypothetical protein